MIRIMAESKGYDGTGMRSQAETVILSLRVTPKALLSMINRFKHLEDPSDGVKRWMIVNGTRLRREQIYGCPRNGDFFEWAELVLEELAVSAAKRRASAKQARAASRAHQPLKFGL